MQKKKNDFQHLGICHRLFNFIMNSLIARGMKRVTLGHPMPKGSTSQEPLDDYARMNSKLKDESDSIVQIQFKKTEALDCWTSVDKFGSPVHLAAIDDKAMEKEIPILNGISVGNTKPQVQGKTGLRIQGEGSTGPKIIIPITKSADPGEKKKMAHKELHSANLATPKQPDASKPMLTGLGLNINEISETFIQNTKNRLSRNVSLMEPEES